MLLLLLSLNLLAGLLLHGCIFASLMRPLTGRRRKPAVLLNKSEENGHGFLSAEDFMKHRNKLVASRSVQCNNKTDIEVVDRPVKLKNLKLRPCCNKYYVLSNC